MSARYDHARHSRGCSLVSNNSSATCTCIFTWKTTFCFRERSKESKPDLGSPGRHVLRVVNEYGAVNLFGRGLRERAAAPTSIPHPDHRAEVRRTITEIRYFDLE